MMHIPVLCLIPRSTTPSVSVDLGADLYMVAVRAVHICRLLQHAFYGFHPSHPCMKASRSPVSKFPRPTNLQASTPGIPIHHTDYHQLSTPSTSFYLKKRTLSSTTPPPHRKGNFAYHRDKGRGIKRGIAEVADVNCDMGDGGKRTKKDETGWIKSHNGVQSSGRLPTQPRLPDTLPSRVLLIIG